MGLAKLAGRFINADHAVCDRIEELSPLPFNRKLLSVHSLAIVAEIGKRAPAAMVLDIGEFAVRQEIAEGSSPNKNRPGSQAR